MAEQKISFEQTKTGVSISNRENKSVLTISKDGSWKFVPPAHIPELSSDDYGGSDLLLFIADAILQRNR